MSAETVNVIGAGQCGTLLSIMLAGHGYQVELYERHEDPRVVDPEAGRSINLALAARGINALKHAGIYDLVEPRLVPMKGRMVHDVHGTTTYMSYGQASDEQIYSVTRTDLNQILLDAAESLDNVNINFRQKAFGYDAPDCTVHMRDLTDNSLYEIEARPLFAADGAGSVIRRSFDGSDTFGGIETLLRHGYKELSIPAAADGSYQLEPDALHIWPRGGFMLIALPNPGGDFTLTLFLPIEDEPGFSTLTSAGRIETFFEENFPDAAALIENLGEDMLQRPLGILGTIRCRHWHDRGNVLLIGDAAHAVVPFHGQGMNLAFEDCVVLDNVMRSEDGDWQTIFTRFEEEQLFNANAIADMALENYIEMRDTVRDPKFAVRKALAFELERRLPEYFIPRYSMVMFHANIPYRIAFERGEIQKRLLEEFTRTAETLADIDIEAAAAAVKDRLPLIEDVSSFRTA
jgi:kynurenine 3-monooxygenase